MKCEGGWWDQIFRALVASGYDPELSLLSSELFLTNQEGPGCLTLGKVGAPEDYLLQVCMAVGAGGGR